VYILDTARQRRTLARRVGIAIADAERDGLDELLEVPRSAWTGGSGAAEACAEGAAA
jgi:hypothetical protein